jgi:RimJ/RimL family protein N-acetyltransferase
MRPFEAADLDRLAELFRNPGFLRFSGATEYDREKTAALLDKLLGWTKAGLPSQFALINREDNVLIGYCGFLHQEVDERKEIEIAYRLHPDYWNKGLATEAARAVRDRGFRDWGLKRVISLIHVDNKASRRVAEKNGMRMEGTTIFRGFPTQVFAIERAEWLALTAERADSPR